MACRTEPCRAGSGQASLISVESTAFSSECPAPSPDDRARRAVAFCQQNSFFSPSGCSLPGPDLPRGEDFHNEVTSATRVRPRQKSPMRLRRGNGYPRLHECFCLYSLRPEASCANRRATETRKEGRTEFVKVDQCECNGRGTNSLECCSIRSRALDAERVSVLLTD